jgi:hypothetical protein
MLAAIFSTIGMPLINAFLEKGLDAFKAYENKQISIEQLKDQLYAAMTSAIKDIEVAHAEALAKTYASFMDAMKQSVLMQRVWASVVLSQLFVLLWAQLGVPLLFAFGMLPELESRHNGRVGVSARRGMLGHGADGAALRTRRWRSDGPSEGHGRGQVMGWSRHIGHIVNRLREMGGYVPADEMSVLAEGLARFVQEQFQQLKEITMSVSAQVQTLVEAIAMQTQAISDAGTELAKVEQHAADLEGQVADLGAKLTAALATAPVAGLTDEDIAALTEATAKVTGSVAVLKAAMPAPVAPAAVQAASDAAAVVGGAA